MPTLQEIQARNQALKAAQQANAIAGNATNTTSAGEELDKAVPPPVSNIQTGLQSSQESAGSMINTPQQEFSDEPDVEKLAQADAAFRATGLRKFFRANGEPVNHVQGFFYINDEDDLAQMRHYERIGKVEQIKPAKS